MQGAVNRAYGRTPTDAVAGMEQVPHGQCSWPQTDWPCQTCDQLSPSPSDQGGGERGGASHPTVSHPRAPRSRTFAQLPPRQVEELDHGKEQTLTGEIPMRGPRTPRGHAGRNQAADHVAPGRAGGAVVCGCGRVGQRPRSGGVGQPRNLPRVQAKAIGQAPPCAGDNVPGKQGQRR